MTLGLINANPVVNAKKERHAHTDDPLAVYPLEIYDHVRDIRDPEHPYHWISVLSEESITVDEKLGVVRILITFTPTIQHCTMASNWSMPKGEVERLFSSTF